LSEMGLCQWRVLCRARPFATGGEKAVGIISCGRSWIRKGRVGMTVPKELGQIEKGESEDGGILKKG